MNNEVKCNGMGEMPGQEGRDYSQFEDEEDIISATFNSKPKDLTECSKCKTLVGEGQDCPKCGKYMPTGDDLADMMIAQSEDI